MSCGNNNWARRIECNKCHMLRGPDQGGPVDPNLFAMYYYSGYPGGGGVGLPGAAAMPPPRHG